MPLVCLSTSSFRLRVSLLYLSISLLRLPLYQPLPSSPVWLFDSHSCLCLTLIGLFAPHCVVSPMATTLLAAPPFVLLPPFSLLASPLHFNQHSDHVKNKKKKNSSTMMPQKKKELMYCRPACKPMGLCNADIDWILLNLFKFQTNFGMIYLCLVHCRLTQCRSGYSLYT